MTCPANLQPTVGIQLADRAEEEFVCRSAAAVGPSGCRFAGSSYYPDFPVGREGSSADSDCSVESGSEGCFDPPPGTLDRSDYRTAAIVLKVPDRTDQIERVT